MKRNDYKLIGIVCVIAVAIFFFVGGFQKEKASYVQITVDGEFFGEFDLKKDQDISIQEMNTLRIQNGMADMIDATCPDHLCVEQKPINKVGESLICLPNKVIVTVTKGEEKENDTIVK